MATRQSELTLLVVGRHGARLAGLRLEYSGETSCPASTDDLSALLDRRPADAIVFLSHGDLADALLDYLKRRGRPLPTTVISLGDGLGESHPRLAAALRRLGDATDPRHLLAELFEAVGVAHPAPHEPLPAEAPAAPADAPPADAEEPDTRHADRARRLQVVLEHRLAGSSDT